MVFYTTGSMWAKNTHLFKNDDGFTIVELLIAIVVIAILASITVVAFNGAQDQAKFSKYQSEMKSIVKALAMHKEVNGNYPVSINRPNCDFDWCGWDQATGDDFIVGLSPQFINRIPQMDPSLPKADTFLYRSNSSRSEYQLIRYRSDALGKLPQAERDNPLSLDGTYDDIAWGYRSNPNTAWW